jgi:hypothetical protein
MPRRRPQPTYPRAPHHVLRVLYVVYAVHREQPLLIPGGGRGLLGSSRAFVQESTPSRTTTAAPRAVPCVLVTAGDW